ncbi:hypothetical protein [Opitutus terrae]|uniref:Uncharacterized protein n=1 Tax=Opitutus terrae (strain DSM 11246 / JCM 15787 / PB90-1) TaxID=452637 RepID=B1ZXU6_OPITP|nr:hypothetical protein [Opitutus terrae]ACB75148.1 hypothetical protein Oter_1865 [Opitutus terrae PB90-1]
MTPPVRSLGATLDALADSLFFARPITSADRTRAAQSIAARQGLPGAYAGMFAPTDRDRAGYRLFTGEPVHSRVGIAHLLGEEACRVLTLLNVRELTVQSALDRAIAGMAAQLDRWERSGHTSGTYCCGTCSGGYWRNVALNLFPRSEERLQLGLAELKQARTGDGRWRRFPLFHTSLVLTEIAPEFARDELLYAAVRWRRILPRLSTSSAPFARRRAAVGRRLLEQCDR